MKTYNIGDEVWIAKMTHTEETVTCPECFGKKFLTVILGDDSKVTIDCAGCGPGYNPPTGRIGYLKYSANVSSVTITKLEITRDYVEYVFDSCCITKEVFATKEEARIKATELAKEYNKRELEKIYSKEKNNRTWSWNVHYHRDCIRRAEKDLVYHKSKLDTAKIKSTEVK